MKNRVIIFIDGNNFYHGSKNILKSNEKINYNKLVDFLWKKIKSDSFVKLEIGSGANKFFVC